MFSARLKQSILAAARHPWATLGIVAVLSVLALAYVAAAFDMTTDTGELISAKTPWRQNGATIESAFPQLKDAIAVIIDGDTPELAEAGAARLAEALAADSAHFPRVKRPDGGAFFASNGLLFASLADVKDTTQRLIDAQPLLGALAADPSLRGVATAMDTAASGATNGQATPQSIGRLAAPLFQLSTTINASLAGKPTAFSWQRLFAGAGKSVPMAPPNRRVLIVHPKLDFGDLEPGAAAVAAIRQHADRLGIAPAHGQRLGITGEVPLADEEFGSIRDNIGFVGALMGAAMLLTLWLATRSARTVVAIMVTILAGLVITLALGLAAVGRLNLISVAFIPLFVGLGVDFGIQVAVRFNAERREGAEPLPALAQTAEAIGEPLLMAAAAIFLALGAFLPTDYIGIAELGVIAGVGMIIAFVLNVTLLPALLVLLRPPVPASEVGWRGAAPVDRWLERNRLGVLWSFIGAMAVSIGSLGWVVFDFNPLHLRDPHGPAMSALADLMRDADRTPNTISVLAPNMAAADRLAASLSRLPQVRQAVTLDSFIPEGQPEKLILIQDASLLLDATVNPFDLPQPTDDATTQAELTKAAHALDLLARSRSDDVGHAAAALSASFARLAMAPPTERARVDALLSRPLEISLNAIRASLQAGQITRDSLPQDIRDDWVAKDGRALVQVSPAGNSLDNAVLTRFTAAVRAQAPAATGLPVATQEAAHTVATAFIHAGVLALILVSLLLYLVLRSLREVVFTLAPVVLSMFLTLGSCVVIGQPLNFANIIAFPLLFGVGVAFHIYFVMAWRRGTEDLLQTSLARAVVFSALATGSAFGALWFSHHPGTASMGLILMISLVWTLICALIFEPALLGPVPGKRRR